MDKRIAEVEFFFVEAICPNCNETVELKQSEVKSKEAVCSVCNSEFIIELEE